MPLETTDMDAIMRPSGRTDTSETVLHATAHSTGSSRSIRHLHCAGMVRAGMQAVAAGNNGQIGSSGLKQKLPGMPTATADTLTADTVNFAAASQARLHKVQVQGPQSTASLGQRLHSSAACGLFHSHNCHPQDD